MNSITIPIPGASDITLDQVQVLPYHYQGTYRGGEIIVGHWPRHDDYSAEISIRHARIRSVDFIPDLKSYECAVLWTVRVIDALFTVPPSGIVLNWSPVKSGGEITTAPSCTGMTYTVFRLPNGLYDVTLDGGEPYNSLSVAVSQVSIEAAQEAARVREEYEEAALRG